MVILISNSELTALHLNPTWYIYILPTGLSSRRGQTQEDWPWPMFCPLLIEGEGWAGGHDLHCDGSYTEGMLYRLLICELSHRVGTVLSFFSSRRNWDSPAGECVTPLPVLGGVAHSLASEGVHGGSQFRRGDIHGGTLYLYVLCVISIPAVGKKFVPDRLITLQERMASHVSTRFSAWYFINNMHHTSTQLECAVVRSWAAPALACQVLLDEASNTIQRMPNTFLSSSWVGHDADQVRFDALAYDISLVLPLPLAFQKCNDARVLPIINVFLVREFRKYFFVCSFLGTSSK